jgi:hypothetical protein
VCSLVQPPTDFAGPPMERCLACEADGEQGKIARHVLFDFYAL